jgi:hypothetical protein
MTRKLLLLTMLFTALTTTAVWAADPPPHNPQPGPDPPKCAPASTPGCSDHQDPGPDHDTGSDDDEGGGNG